MQKEIIEYEKLRSIDISYEQYTYTESIKTESNGDYTEFFNMIKGQNYTFYYCNALGNPKDGKFTIEHDSIFIQPFLTLVQEKNSFKVMDDHSEKFIEFSKNKNNGVDISIHLLPNMMDGTICVKNIMFDLRSRADAMETDVKKRLSMFFDELIKLMPLLEEKTSQKVFVKK